MTDEQRPAALGLWQQLWRGGRHANAAYFRWKFIDNPTPVDHPVQAATIGGEVVGLAAVHGARWEVNGERHVVPCVGDLVVAPAHRGSSVFHDLLAASVEQQRNNGNPILFDFANGPYVPSMLMRGWRTTGPLTTAHVDNRRPHPLMERVRELGARLRRAEDGSEEPTGWARPWPDPFRRLRADAEVEVSGTARPVEMAALVDRLGPTGALRGVRDEAFLEWRFKNPLARYRFLYTRGPELEGYLVLGLNRPSSSREHLIVVDLVATTDDVADALLGRAVAANAGLLTAWPGSDERDLQRYERLGFVLDRPTGRSIDDIDRPMVLMKQSGSGGGAPVSLGSEPIDDLERWDPSPIFFDEA